MPTRPLVPALLALFFVAGHAEAQFRPQATVVPPEDFHLEVGVMFWQPTPELVLTTGDVNAGSVDFVADLGVTEGERFRETHAVLRLGRKHKLRFAYLPFQYSADTVLARTLTFGNRTFPAGANATADLDWKLYRGGYEWDVIALSKGFIGVIAELKHNRVTANLSASAAVLGTTQTVSAAVDQTAPVPTIGGIARGYLGRYLSLTGEFTGLKLDRDDFYGKFYDLDIYGDLHLGRNLGVRAGYRAIEAEYAVDGDEGTLKMTGPYLGGFLRF